VLTVLLLPLRALLLPLLQPQSAAGTCNSNQHKRFFQEISQRSCLYFAI
jgi:hypothetical protein